MVTQIVMFKDIVTAEKIAKTLQNHTPSLPSGVKGIVRAKGFLTSTQFINILLADTATARYLHTENYTNLENYA